MDAIRHLAHCGRCGARSGDQPDGPGGPFRCPVCGFTLYFNAAGAVGAVIRRADGRVLFVRRSMEPSKGKLGMPGGFVDPGESVEQALAREVREEVGLEIVEPRYLFSHANRYVYTGVTYHTVDMFFVADAVEVERAEPLDAVEAVEWLDVADVRPDDLAFDSMRAVVALLRTRLPG
jgi:NAD+ diphosphatase